MPEAYFQWLIQAQIQMDLSFSSHMQSILT